jgi:hypothetical protein
MRKALFGALVMALALAMAPAVVLAQPAGPPVAQPGKPLSKDQAKALVEQYIHNNPKPEGGQGHREAWHL